MNDCVFEIIRLAPDTAFRVPSTLPAMHADLLEVEARRRTVRLLGERTAAVDSIRSMSASCDFFVIPWSACKTAYSSPPIRSIRRALIHFLRSASLKTPPENMFEQYEHAIRSLPRRDEYKRDELLIPPLLIAREGRMSVYLHPVRLGEYRCADCPAGHHS